ncbi:response regulator [Nodosilinea sp. PGN35]|uniref:response regulator n=1 Tax=Nodosilinea sp. PGN35 TaxID=3020489 RepID=UPI0023B31264|nr:response regulator [Nodosilinea sp. TSF1-S3]MDF0365942.1 response regulator [Nodosilinea sp. TSF1-S3]
MANFSAVELPLPSAATARYDAACTPGAESGRRHLLLIDNEPDICLLVQDALREFEGWQVTTCPDSSALDIGSRPPWDAILLEISVDQITQAALVLALRSHPQTCRLPIVLLTSQVMARDYARFEQMEVAGVIAKPFDPVTLGRQIAQLLGWADGGQRLPRSGRQRQGSGAI